MEALTGIKAHTLRIWEQRYKIPKPKRTSTNIRYYDDDDLKLLLNISLLNNDGSRISDIAKLTQEEINSKVLEYASRSNDADIHLQALVTAMIGLDEIAFEKLISGHFQQRGIERSFSEIIFPFLKKLGQLWMSGSIHPAYEHFVSNLIRQNLIVATHALKVKKSRLQWKFLLFLPEGESHELGLLFANYLIRSRGHTTVFIGQSTPIVDLEKIYLKYKPDFLFSSITMDPLQIALRKYAETLIEKFPGSRLILTGYHAVSNKEKLPPTTLVIESTEMFLKFLER
jgi:DNA-binding transcriptional MerR regulator